MSDRIVQHKLLAWVTAVIVVAAGAGLAILLGSHVRHYGAPAATITTKRAPPNADEVLMVVLVSSACDWSKAPGFADSLRQLSDALRLDAAKQGLEFSTLGVALDYDVRAGLTLLTRIGTFDEVTAGHSWLNSGAIDYVWRDLAGEPGLPQVVLVRRTVLRGAKAIAVGPDRLLRRAIGAQAIVQWIHRAPSLAIDRGVAADQAMDALPVPGGVDHE